ncbi:MAG: DEAD/DEAH box helicase [Acidobacteriota bacterium]|nr:DEAD/DEAH box helicase [Acidobacteriota bacterium]
MKSPPQNLSFVKLSTRLEPDFSSAVRKRAKEYYWQGLVRIEHGTADEVKARVSGSQPYNVRLTWKRPVLSARCECQYFDTEGLCKHIWATLLAAEARGHLISAALSGTLDLQEDYSDAIQDFQLSPPPNGLGPPVWRKQVADLLTTSAQEDTLRSNAWPAKKEIVYQVDASTTSVANRLILLLGSRDLKADGGFSRVSPLKLKRSQVAQLPSIDDREILSALAGGVEHFSWSAGYGYDTIPSSIALTSPLAAMVVPLAIRTGRCSLKESRDPGVSEPLTWDGGDRWKFELSVKRSSRGGWNLTGELRRGEECLDVTTARLISNGLIFLDRRVGQLADDSAEHWIAHLRKAGPIEAPQEAGEELVAELLRSPRLAGLSLPEELRYEEATPTPRPLLKIGGSDRPASPVKLRADLLFDYDGNLIASQSQGSGWYQSAERRFIRRDPAAEQQACELLEKLGMKLQRRLYQGPEPGWELTASKLPRTVRTLIEAGWQIEADGKLFRRPGAFRMGIASGVDWFELHGEVEYENGVARLPELLEALRRGENVVRLDDGSYGLLPEEWLQRIGAVAGMGAPQNGSIHFRKNQAGLLDALLAVQPEASCDETFTRVRQELRFFNGVQTVQQPDGFVGQLRDYQREGLSWMEFLRRFSFGGCLADDMGVGKTAQVLAMLETRRALRAAGEAIPPSLVIVPRSLVFNWKGEAARFTPQLRLLDYTGLGRKDLDFDSVDVVLTTYGTVRRDAADLKDTEFDYLVLDEAQAVKNAGTESAKAVRLLQGRHRLALSGTPVENHLGELFSLFEFLNPGMLGTASVLKLASGAVRTAGEETRMLLAHALRPFILRRTKEQVARELPQKTEQTISCEMDAPQRKLYNELRQHYRSALLGRIEKQGLAKSKIQVLEALLRLRQAACHPGLIDKKRSNEGSAKFDVLLDRLREVLDEGHKALIFSQFTSMLKIVGKRLDEQGLIYEYLDGATRDRQARVERFQTDEACSLFLISLKAGGLGLNLTAADYVFLLDPWWNPAVEMQAIDRTHRIGQSRHVFAYRLITRDTVEEKVLELQKTKRDLAAAIIGEENSLIRNLKREDLELLLS